MEDNIDDNFEAMDDDFIHHEEEKLELVEAEFLKATIEVPISTAAEKRKTDYENKGIKKKRIAHSNTEVLYH